MTTDEGALREGLVAASRRIAARGLSHGSTGNISVRAGAGILISPTGSRMAEVEPGDLSLIDLQGVHLDGPPPSKEAFLHAAVFRARPQSAAIVHTHSTHAVAVSCLDDVDPTDVLPPITAYYAMRVGALPLLSYFAPGDPALEGEAERIARSNAAFLLRNHGPVVAGADLDAAVDSMEELEQTAKVYLLLAGHRIRPLDGAQRAALRPAD